MPRIACVMLLLVVPAPVRGADLPPGAVARLGDDRFRTGGAVSHLALAPDGRRYATAHATAPGRVAVTVWDAGTGRPVHEHLVSANLFKGLVWGERGAFAIAARATPGTNDEPAEEVPGDFCVWDFTDPKAAPPLVDLPRLVERTSGAIDGSNPFPATYTGFWPSADGSHLATRWVSADEKHAVHVFKLKPAGTVAKLDRVATLDLGAEGADGVGISADGTAVVTARELSDPERRGTRESVVTVWRVADGKPGKPARVPGGARFMLAPDARSLVACTADGKEWGFDVAPITPPYKSPPRSRQRVRWPLPPDAAPRDSGGFAFFPSGAALAVATERGTLVLDVQTGSELARLEGHADVPGAVAVAADGTRIATADAFGLVRLWDAKTFRALHDAPGHRVPVAHAELSPDGKRLLTWAEDETVRLWDVATGRELRAFAGAPGLKEARTPGSRPTFAPDGAAILFGTKDRLVGRDLQTGLEVPLPGDLARSEPRNAVFAPDGKSVLTWAAPGTPLVVYDWPSGAKRFDLSPDGPVSQAHFAPDSASVVADARDPKRWDAKTGNVLTAAWADGRSVAVQPLATLRPNPLLLVRNLREETSRVIEGGTGTPLPGFRFGRPRDNSTPFLESEIALAPAGGSFAAPRHPQPGAVLVEAATQAARRELNGHRSSARVLGFTPDGSKLLTAGGDHTVLVWDVRLQAVPLPDAIKQETNAAKLWDRLARGDARDAYLAMARLSREPDAAVKLVRLKLKPATKGGEEDPSARVTDARAVELLEALDTDQARALLKELAGGGSDAVRTQEAKRALERIKKK